MTGGRRLVFFPVFGQKSFDSTGNTCIRLDRFDPAQKNTDFHAVKIYRAGV